MYKTYIFDDEKLVFCCRLRINSELSNSVFIELNEILKNLPSEI
jgi:hypothetical protein